MNFNVIFSWHYQNPIQSPSFEDSAKIFLHYKYKYISSISDKKFNRSFIKKNQPPLFHWISVIDQIQMEACWASVKIYFKASFRNRLTLPIFNRNIDIERPMNPRHPTSISQTSYSQRFSTPSARTYSYQFTFCSYVFSLRVLLSKNSQLHHKNTFRRIAPHYGFRAMLGMNYGLWEMEICGDIYWLPPMIWS